MTTAITIDQLDAITSAIEAVYPMAYPLDIDGDNSAIMLRDTLESTGSADWLDPVTARIRIAEMLRDYAHAISPATR